MKQRLFFITLFFMGVVVAGFYFTPFISGFNFTLPNLGVFFFILISLGIFLQLAAHWLRAYKSLLLINQIRTSRVSDVFKGLSVGYLFNVLLPFRAGELIRAYYVGDALAISKTAVLISILIERIFDGILLSSLFILSSFFIQPISTEVSSLFLQFGLGIFSISLILSGFIYIIRTENRYMLRAIHTISAIFNVSIANRLRFMAWSGIHGTKLMLNNTERLVRYVFITLITWVLYFASVSLIAKAFFIKLDFARIWVITQSTYAGVSTPSGPGYLGTFYEITSRLFVPLQLVDKYSFSIVNWLVLVIPIAIIGLVVLISQKFRTTAGAPTRQALLNKLYREADISSEFSHFLDAYFKGEKINQLLSEAESHDKFRLVKSFKGGSNAQTMLVWQEKELRVKKITLSQYADKLKAQAAWLMEREDLNHLPRVINEEETTDYYYFDLKYLENFYPFFEYMHKNTPAKSYRILKDMLAFMEKNIYVNATKTTSEQNLQDYIENKVLGKVTDTARLSQSINTLLSYKSLVINGSSYQNIQQVIERLRKNKQAVMELSTYYETPIHGDLTVDNLIVSSDNDFLVIDPNNENQISAPVVDYGKLYQSLHSGYEFLIQLEKCGVNSNEIVFEDSTSHKYAEVFHNLNKLLKQNLSAADYRAILFHEAVHYCRMLTYRVNINPDTVPVFYATAVKLFNEYLEQYEK